MNKEIGSEFYLDKYEDLEDKPINLDYLKVNINDTAFLSTSKNVVYFLLEQNKIPEDRKIVLLPPFTCHSVIEPFVKDGYRVFYHRITRDLTCDRELFLEDLDRIRPSVVIVHGQFGFDTLVSVKDIIQNIKTTGVLVIEDITHTLYSDIERTYADYYIFDFERWTALPDGEGVISTKKSFPFRPFKADIELQEKRLEAFHAKYLYIEKNIGEKEDYLELFNEAEELSLSRKTIYAMSPVSKRIQSNLDIDFLKTRRRENYTVLLRGLKNSSIVQPVFDELEEGIVPMYFALYVKCNRIKLRVCLSENCIYSKVKWSKAPESKGDKDRKTESLYDNILALPCDQRYDQEDMNRIIEVINEYESSIDDRKSS